MRTAKLAIILLGVFALLLPAVAQADSAWWHLTSGARPSHLPSKAGAKGEIVINATNLGDAAADGGAAPITIEDFVPAGLKLRSTPEGVAGSNWMKRGPVVCHKEQPARCTFGGTLPPYDQIEVRIKVETLAGAHSGEANELTVSGGGSPPTSISRPLSFAGEPTGFGVESYELSPEEAGGTAATQAGSHPFQLTTAIGINQAPATNGVEYDAHSVALTKDVRFRWPAGLLGNPSQLPRCGLAEFLSLASDQGETLDLCPGRTAVGVAVVNVDEPHALHVTNFTLPIFNLEPSAGEPARVGFWVPIVGVPVLIDPSVRSGSGEDYGVTITTANINQAADFLSAKATVWGVPGDPRHDNSRGWDCLLEARGLAHNPCQPAEDPNAPAFVTLPTTCSGSSLQTSAEADSWVEPASLFSANAEPPMPILDGCNRLAFNPTVRSAPTSDAATSPTGLSFDLSFNDEGLDNSSEGALAESQMKKAVVTLPKGFTTNPSVAEGLKACGQGDYEAATLQTGTGCTPESKIGDVEIESPLAEGKKVTGGLYVAKQKENPNGNLLSLYLIARNPEIGVLVRQALKVTPDPVTGQLTTEVDNVPQLPFSRFHLSFRSGQRSPLITPPACGTYSVEADLYPWSQPSFPVHRESSFQITQGPEGLPCPSGGLPPFHPSLLAGSLNPTAGAYSPFYTDITRKDSEQEITHFSIKLPPGELANLSSVGKCSDQQIDAAKAREHEGGGQEELDDPSCPALSQVGRTTVGTGVGNVLAYAPGKLYLAGPYHGAPISLVAITAAKVGPFDLGTVVVRFALRVNPETGQASVDGQKSDPIPHIVDGIPVHLRDVQAFVDRPGFTLNPTNCERTSTASTVLGAGLDFVSEADDNPITVSSPFQVGNCAALGFKPKLALRVSGPSHRGGVPKLKATVTYPKGGPYANIAKSVLTLPFSEILEQGHIGTSCTRVQFNAGNGNGEGCPAASIYGHARATTPLLDEPLEGPVYLRSNGGERNLPDLVAALHGQEIDIDLVGFVDSVQKKGSERSRIRNTFAAVPDAPVEKFTLEMEGGKKGLLVNTTNICKGTHRAVSVFTGQNGKVYKSEPKVVAAGCGGKKGKGHTKHKHG